MPATRLLIQATAFMVVMAGVLVPVAALGHGDSTFGPKGMVFHACVKIFGGDVRIVGPGPSAACLSDEREIHLARPVVIADATGLVIGPVSAHSTDEFNQSVALSVIVKVDKFWATATFTGTTIEWSPRSHGRVVLYEQPDCLGDAYVRSFLGGAHPLLTSLITIGPSFSVYTPFPGARVREIMIVSLRGTDGTCQQLPVPVAEEVVRAKFVMDLGWTPPFTLRNLK
jgi:hypothetical protein